MVQHQQIKLGALGAILTTAGFSYVSVFASLQHVFVDSFVFVYVTMAYNKPFPFFFEFSSGESLGMRLCLG